MGKQLTTEDFITKATKIHNGKYDYSKVEYVNTKTKVCIICPEHGEFWQTPRDHLSGRGCPLCAKNHRITQEEWVEKAREKQVISMIIQKLYIKEVMSLLL